MKKNIDKYFILSITIFIILIILFFIGFVVNNNNLLLTVTVLFCFFNIISSLKSFRFNINFIIFNITFFVLLLGRYFLEMLSGKDYSINFSNDITKNTILLLFISLVALYIGKNFFELCKKRWNQNRQLKVNKKKVEEKKEKIIYVRQIARIMFFITFSMTFAIVLEQAIFVQQNTYIALYTEFQTQIPSIIHKIAETNFIFLMIYLFTFPGKKETFIVIAIYMVYLIISVLTGDRAALVIGILIFFIYFIYRERYFKKERYFTKKVIAVIVILGIGLIIFLSCYNTLRNNIPIEDFNPFNQFKQFFIDQGGSVNIISYTQYYKDELPDTNSSYAFGPFINYIKYGTLSRILGFGQEYYDTNTEEMALYGNNLGATISYLVMPERYLNGEGLGAQYIAEIYVDCSYLGVIIYNLILGFLLMWFNNLKKENWIGLAFSFNILKSLIYLPRQSAMGWVVNLLSVPNILAIVLAYGYSEIMYRYKIRRKNEKNTMDS